MCKRTKSNVLTPTLGLTPISVLGPNPYRKAFLLTPIAGGVAVASPVVAVVFTAGLSQLWPVPAGVTSLIDAYVWGSGGNGGPTTGATGGGGGGAGGFARSGIKTLTPGTVYTVNVDAGAGASFTQIYDATHTLIAETSSGGGTGDNTGGPGGAGTTGLDQRSGGNGFTTAVTAGGGGGGAGGVGSSGTTAVNVNGGAGAGTITLATYGKGGNGGNGGANTVSGHPGLSPGGGGGGAGHAGAAIGLGADGLAVIFYTPSAAQQAISLSKRPNVTAGLGTLNFVRPDFAPYLLSDDWIGNSITDEWFGVSGVAGVQIEITEYSYFTEDVDPAY